MRKSKVRLQMIAIFGVIVLLLSCVFLLPVYSVSAEENNLIVEYKTLDNGSQQKIVKNIQNYFSRSKKLKTNTLYYENNALLEMGFSNEEIKNMTNEDRAVYLSATQVTIAEKTYDGTEVNSKEYTDNQIRVTTQVFKVPSLDRVNSNGQTEFGFIALMKAKWTKMPTYRLKDIMAITVNNSAVFGEDIEGIFTYEQESWNKYTGLTKYNNNHTLKTTNSRVTLYSWDHPAIMIDLPTNVHGFGAYTDYYNFNMEFKTIIKATQSFNLYSAYGHKEGGVSAAISSRGGVSISFNELCNNFTVPFMLVEV